MSLLSGTFWLPEAASTQASNIDTLFYFIYYLSALFFVAIIVTMCYYVVKYRKRPGNETTADIKGNHLIEFVWSAIPTVLLVIIFVWGFKEWMSLNVPPSNSLDIRVTAERWLWTFDYPKDGISTSELVVPVNTPVKLTMSSTDVLHSFFIPEFRIKKDVIPNRYTVIWFESTRVGEFNTLCTEYCGTGHSKMLAKVKVVSEEAYQDWIDSGGGMAKKEGVSSVDFGKMLFSKQACNTCHNLEGQKLVGPPLNGIYGKTEQLESGESITIDDNYLRESMMEPNAKIVKGFAPVMPTYKGKLKDDQVNALIDYLKSLEK
jgi:cytochrome c oxidase subunit II